MRRGRGEADIRDALTGKLIHDCRPDDTADAELFRALPEPTTIRVELIMRNAAKWFRQLGPDVVELYSPPRVVQEAGLRSYGGRRLRPGWSLDLTVDDPETGKPWDLSDGKVRTKVMKLINEGKPYMIIMSPICTAFSQIQAINKQRRDPKIVRQELDDAKDHIRWVMKIAAIQVRCNRYFAFEHPATATSWDMAEIKKVHDMEGVVKVKFDMCQFGMVATDVDGVTRPVQKRTAVLTNSYEVAQRLRRDCPNRCSSSVAKNKESKSTKYGSPRSPPGRPEEACHHVHAKLEGGQRCKQAQVYPRDFCRAICEASQPSVALMR